MNWTRNTIILVAVAVFLTLAAAGTATAYALTGFHARVAATAPATQAPATQVPPTQAPATQASAAQAPAAPAPATQAPATRAPAPAPARPQLTNPAAVVLQYYQDVTDHDWQAAWAIGGRNIAAQNGQTCSSWVSGYTDTTASIDVTDHGTWGNGTVWTDLSAVQLDGSVKTYSGTYTVENGVIVSAHITQTGGPS